MVTYLTDAECRKLLDLDECYQIIEELFRQEAAGKVENRPTTELALPRGVFRLKAGSVLYLNSFGYKAYPFGGRYTIYVYDIDSGLDGIVEGRGLTEYRTGAVSALGTHLMARPDAETMGIIGTGREARAQLAAICRVRPFRKIKAYSRSAENRNEFAKEMTERLGIEVVPVDSGQECVRDVDVVTTITGANEPVLEGAWLREGTHINAVGATTPNRRELDEAAVIMSNLIVVEHRPQAEAECGELLHAVGHGTLSWDRIVELKDLVSGAVSGRTSPSDITLFDTIGVGSEDVAIAVSMIRKARTLGAGIDMPYEPPYVQARAPRPQA